MKKYILMLLALFVVAPVAYAAYGSSNTTQTAVIATTSVTGVNSVKASTTPQEASVDMFLEIEGVKGESKEKSVPEDEVESSFKGQNTRPVEPPGIEFIGFDVESDDDGEPITPDFGILLGGGGGESEDEELTEEEREKVAEILKEGAEEEGLATEQISLNFEKIKVKVSQEVKLLGFIPLSADATVEIDEENEVKVKFPWWAFLASGKEEDELGERVFSTLSNVLKTKHDTVKNSIGNIR